MDEQSIAQPTQYELGFEAYCQGAQLEDVPIPQRRGWWDALDTEADAQTEAYLRAQAELEDYSEDILDREDWAKGGW